MDTCASRDCPPLHGVAQSHCSACHETFTTAKSFEKHQTFPDGGPLRCHEPSSRGLVARRDPAGTRVWGWPDRDQSRDWVSVLRGSAPGGEGGGAQTA